MLFNKATNGAAEVKGLIGFIYKSQTFDNLVTYITIAERDIKKVIGNEVYKLADDHYHSDDYLVDDSPAGSQLKLLDELVKYIQLPVILHAYRRYAPGADLSHSEAGRTITVTEDKKPAFEWMIERDNRNLTDLAHEATDMLLEFLDEQAAIPYVPTQEDPEGEDTPNTIETTWKASASYAATKKVFINSATEFDKIFPIGKSRRLYLALVPFMSEIELRHIRPMITRERYETIIEMIRDGELNDEGNEEEKTIYELSLVPIALLTISVALKRLSVELLPDAVIQSFDAMDVRQSRTASGADRTGVSALLERDGRRELIPLQKYIASLDPETVEEEEETDTEQPFFMA